MFFNTPHELLKPIHSLLKNPFTFAAGISIGEKLRPHLEARDDFAELLKLAGLYDKARLALLPYLMPLRHKLENDLALVIPVDAHLGPVCSNRFAGPTPQIHDMDGSAYLSYVSVQCQLERLYDHFDLKRSGSKNPLQSQECVHAVQVLMLSEVLALAMAGIAKVEQHSGGFLCTASGSQAQHTLRNTWFARAAELSSHMGTMAFANRLAASDDVTPAALQMLTERILEQDLSLPWRKLSDAGRALKSVEQIHVAARLAALLMLLGIQNKTLKMSAAELSQYGLDFSAVATLLQRQSDALVTDQFLLRRDDTLTMRIEGAEKGIRQLFHVLEVEYGDRDALRIHVGGYFYEKTHIRQRIEQGADFLPRFRILDGFDRYKVVGGVQSQCDVEFIIHDTEQNHYYFIQVKHALLGEKAFLEAVIEAIQKDIGKGLLQLREAKRLLNVGALNATMKARGVTDAVPANCSFVLLHNIAQLDFQYAEDGISLYDWATFRNLLKDAECSYGHSDHEPAWIRLPTPLVVSHPTAVIQRLLSEHPAYQQLYSDPWAQERVSISYTLLGKSVQVRGLGI
jgi:hypothetical protein